MCDLFVSVRTSVRVESHCITVQIREGQKKAGYGV